MENKQGMFNTIYGMIKRDFKNMTNDRKYKFTFKTFAVVETLMVRIYVDDNGDEQEQEKINYFNSRSVDVVSENNIDEVTNNIMNQYMNSLEEAKNGSHWIFKKFIKFIFCI